MTQILCGNTNLLLDHTIQVAKKCKIRNIKHVWTVAILIIPTKMKGRRIQKFCFRYENRTFPLLYSCNEYTCEYLELRGEERGVRGGVIPPGLILNSANNSSSSIKPGQCNARNVIVLLLVKWVKCAKLLLTFFNENCKRHMRARWGSGRGWDGAGGQITQ